MSMKSIRVEFPSVSKHRGVCAALLILFMVSGSTDGQDVASPVSLFSYDGAYARPNLNTFQIVEQGQLWGKLEKESSKGAKERLQPFLRKAIWRVWADHDGGRIFLLVGDRGAAKYDGLLVIRARDFRFAGAIRQDMGLDETGLLASKHTGKLFLSHSLPARVDHDRIERRTRIYDYASLAFVGEYSDGLLRVQEESCAVSHGTSLFTNRRIFDLRTGRMAKVTSLYGKDLFPINCESGRVLLLSRGENVEAVISLFDLATNRMVSEIRTSLPFKGFQREVWRLAPNARTVAYDETRNVPVGQGSRVAKTGRLWLFDFKAELEPTQVPLPIDEALYSNGILGFSPRGEMLIYRSGRKILFVSIQKQTLVKELLLPFEPVGIVWQ